MKSSQPYEKATIQYSSLEWNSKKEEFVDLWIKLDLSLAEVARRLKSDSFHATERQWKRKAREWGLRKYTPTEARELEVRRSGLTSEEFLRRKAKALELATAKDAKEIKRMRRFLQRRQRAAGGSLGSSVTSPVVNQPAEDDYSSPTIGETSEEDGAHLTDGEFASTPPHAQLTGDLGPQQTKCPICDTIFQNDPSEAFCRKHIADAHNHELLRCALSGFRLFCCRTPSGKRVTLPVAPTFPMQLYDEANPEIALGMTLSWGEIVAQSIPATVLHGAPLNKSQSLADHKLCRQYVYIETKIFDVLHSSGASITRHGRNLRKLFEGEGEDIAKLRERYENLEQEFFRECNIGSVSSRATVRGAIREAICLGSQGVGEKLN